MTRLTTDQQATLRTKPQYTRLDLFVYRPNEVCRCVLTDAEKGSQLLYVGDITPTGTAITLKANTTLWVGSEAGDDDIGHVRIRSNSFTGESGTITIEENSHINWGGEGVGDKYLTAMDYYEVKPVYPRIIQNPANSEDVIFYKDYDIPYTNQNTNLGSFVHMGSHRARTIDPESNLASIYWTSSGTYNVEGLAVEEYIWSFEGGTPTGSLSAHPGLVTYDTPGNYITSLTVMSASGTITDTSYRYVSIKDKIGYGDTTPIVRWELKGLQGTRGEGGYTADFIVHDLMEIHGNDVIMLTSDDWYGDTKVSFGGNSVQEPYMFFVGYVDKDTIKYDYQRSTVEFSAVSITGIMKKGVGFSVSVESKVSPSTWYELLSMNCQKAIYHYLKWHTTVPLLTDIDFNGTDYNIQYFDSDRTSMFDAVDELMRGTLVGNVCSDRQSNLYLEVEPMAYPDPTGTFTPIMEITRRDWISEPAIDERVDYDQSYMEWGGIYYRGPLQNTFVPMLACAPGKTPAYRGQVDADKQGLALGSQAQLNSMIGNVFANRNSRFPTVNMDLSGNYQNLDIAPFEAVRVCIAKEDTVRNVEIDSPYVPSSITWRYDHKNGLLLTSMEADQLVNGFPGDTITITTTDNDIGSPKFPTLKLPSYTPVAIPPIITGTPTINPDPEIVVLTSTNYGVLYSTNFNEVAPVWQTMNDGLTSGTYLNNLRKIIVTPDESLYLLADYDTGGTDEMGYENIYYSEGVGQPWTLCASYIPGEGRFSDIDVDKYSDGESFATISLNSSGGDYAYVHIGNPTGIGSFVYKINPAFVNEVKAGGKAGIAWSSSSWYLAIQYKNGTTGVLSDPRFHLLNNSGTRLDTDHIYSASNFQSYPGFLFIDGARDTQTSIVWGVVHNGLEETAVITTGQPPEDAKASLPGNLDTVTRMQAISMSPSGVKICGNFNPGTYVPMRSSDGGKTWESMALTVPAGMDCWDNCGDEYGWIFGGGTNVKYTRNFLDDYVVGDANFNKEGNLSPDFPLINIIGMRKVR